MKERFRNNEQQVSMVSASLAIKKNLYQQDASEQNSPFAYRNKQLCG
jgi:hypothetical protein